MLNPDSSRPWRMPKTSPEEEEVEGSEVDESAAWDTFCDHVSTARDLAEEMLALKQMQQGLRNLKCDAGALRDSFDAYSELSHDAAVQALDSLFSTLCKGMEKTTVPSDHHLRKELDDFSSVFTQLITEIATNKAKKTPVMPSPISTSRDSYEETCSLTSHLQWGHHAVGFLLGTIRGIH